MGWNIKVCLSKIVFGVFHFPIHRSGELFFNLACPGSKSWHKNFFSCKFTNFTRASCHFFFKKWAIYNKTITLNLEHTFFLWETIIHNNVSESFLFVDHCQLNLIETKNIPD